MADNVTLETMSRNSGAYPKNTVMATKQLGDGSHAQKVVAVNTSGAATDPATETTLDAVLDELKLKADLTETQPINGTVTANLSATDNAVLDDILTDLQLKSDKTEIQPVQLKDQYAYTVDATPNSEMLVTNKIRLVGVIFNGATVDPNFWTSAVSTGTVTQVSSELVLTSGTANGHYARAYSVRRANWVTGTSNKFRAQMRVGSSDADVTVRFGVGWGATMPTVTDGAYFKLVGSTLSVNTMANTSETSVASGSFNGTYAAPTLTNNNTYEILYTLGKVFFLINNIIIHTATFSTTHWTSGTTNFHAFADVVNTGDSSAIAHTFRMINITRLGQMLTVPQYKYIAGANTAQVCKYGGGILHNILVGTGVNGKTINVFDDTAGTANQIAGITLPNSPDPVPIEFECPFFNGLTVTPNDTGLKITVVYE